MGMTLPDRPEVLARIADEISPEVADLLAAAVGGTQVMVSERPGVDSAVVRAIGLEGARRLWRVFGSGHLLIPLGAAGERGRQAQRRAEAGRLLDLGLSPSQVARAVHLHVMTVYRLRKRMRMSGAAEGGRRASR